MNRLDRLIGRGLCVSGLLVGTIAAYIVSPDFRIPATTAEFGERLYVVNARFDVAPPGLPAPGVEFEVVAVDKKY